MKGPFSDPSQAGLGSHVPSALETEESKRRASLQSVVDLPGTTFSLLAQGGLDLHGAPPPYCSLPSDALPISSSTTPFPCLIPSPPCLFWVPGFVEMLCSHSNHMPLSLPLPEPEMAWG